MLQLHSCVSPKINVSSCCGDSKYHFMEIWLFYNIPYHGYDQGPGHVVEQIVPSSHIHTNRAKPALSFSFHPYHEDVSTDVQRVVLHLLWDVPDSSVFSGCLSLFCELNLK